MAETPTTTMLKAAQPVDIHPALEEVRRLPEFQPQEPGLFEQLMKDPKVREMVEHFQKSIDAFFKHLRETIQHAMPTGSPDVSELVIKVLSYALTVLLVFLVIVGIYLILTYIRRQIDKKTDAPEPVESDRLSAALINADWHQREANRLAGENNHREAVRQMFLATLCLLEEKRVVPYDATRSDLEYLNELLALPASELPACFKALADDFEYIRYGDGRMDAEGFGNYQNRFAELARSASGSTSEGHDHEK